MKPKNRFWMVVTAGSLILAIAVSTGPAVAQASSGWGTAEVLSGVAASEPQTRLRVANTYEKLPLSFEVNRGQTNPQVKFVARGAGYALFLTNGEAVLAMATEKRGNETSPALHRSVARMTLLGANSKAVVSGMDELPGKNNYFIGNDPSKWRTDVPNYARVKFQNIYPGVDLIYYGNQAQLEYDFLVAPGTDPKSIIWKVESSLIPADKKHLRDAPLKIDHDGNLLVGLNGEEIRFQKPIAYQDITVTSPQSKTGSRKFIEAHYVLRSKNQVGIRLSTYDAALPLVIDPVVWYSSYLGGSSSDQASGIAVDGAGNVYLAGYTQSLDFPKVNQTSGACQAGCDSGNDDGFVTKISASGKIIEYSSYLGGSGGDSVSSIAVDGSGNAYLTGGGNSSDFPRVHQISGACRGGCGNGSSNDAFVTKINAAGNALVYSSLIGGSGDEDDGGFAGIAVDSSGNAYITGNTVSTDFPRVSQIPGACLGSCGTASAQDVFVTKINPSGTALVYSSYVGSSGTDIGFGIAVDRLDNAYLTGLTLSSDFPRVHQIAGACNGDCSNSLNYDVYVTKINAAGTALVYSSYIGGSDQDYGRGIAVDSSGNAYLAGRASSTDFPVISQIPDACPQNSCSAFVTKINAAGSALVYSSRFGGSSGAGQAHAIAVDDSGSAYVTGETLSSDFPRVNPIMAACRGTCGSGTNLDGFVIKVNATGSALVYSSYLGGSGDDNGGSFVCNSSIAVDSLQNAYLSGCTRSFDFPLVPKSIPGACHGSCGTGGNIDGFVIKISP